MSESERMPGYLKRSQVPPLAARLSGIATLLPGRRVRSWHAAPMPESPAPTIRTSTCSVIVPPGCGLVSALRDGAGSVDLYGDPAVKQPVDVLDAPGLE